VSLPYWTLAQLGLARAYAESGDTDKSKSAYRDFLELWKNADSGAPILKKSNHGIRKAEGQRCSGIELSYGLWPV